MTSLRSASAPGANQQRSMRRQYLAAAILAVVLSACGGAESVDSSRATDVADTSQGVGSGASAEHAAAENLPNLQSGETAFDVEVLSVADGSAVTVRSVVTGDRPVLVWFWAPH